MNLYPFIQAKIDLIPIPILELLYLDDESCIKTYG